MKTEHPNKMIIIFDTDCVMCSRWVGFVLRHERTPTARFVSAWSAEGLSMAFRHGLLPEDLDKTYIVVLADRALT